MQRSYWIILLVVGILVIEIIAGRHRKVHHRQDYFIIASTLIGGQLTRPIVALITATLIGLALPAYKDALANVSFWLTFPVLFVVAEFFQYWIHRMAHDSNRHKLLYGMHRTHHSAPYVNVTLMYRSNLVWPLVHSYTWTTAIAFYLGAYGAATAFYLTMLSWNALTHSDFRWDEMMARHLPFGDKILWAMELVLVTPRIHHTHHGFGKDGKAYRNFCTMLSIYDRMFGTLHIPEGRPRFYGLPGGEHHWFRQMLYPLVPLGEPLKLRDKRDNHIAPHPEASPASGEQASLAGSAREAA